MPQYVITPWKYHAELLLVRRQIFGEEGCPSTADQRRVAVNQIRRWKMRSSLPHAVESTANLIDAMLHDDGIRNTVFTIRSAYSLAFSRFVTGFCDIGQNTVRKRSMFDVAAEIGMPSSFVELRHEVTHDEMPSLQRLQQYSQLAMSWLWDNYWGQLEDPDATKPGPISDRQMSIERMRAELSDFRTRRAEEIRQRSKDLSTNSASAVACVKLIKLCLGYEDALKRLAGVMLEERMLVPAGRKSGDSMDVAFLMWGNLLRRLTLHQTQFLKVLVGAMVQEIVQASSMTSQVHDIRLESVHEWLLHIMRGWERHQIRDRFEGLADYIVGECVSSVNNWSKSLAKTLIADGNEAFQEQWKPLFEVDGMDID